MARGSGPIEGQATHGAAPDWLHSCRSPSGRVERNVPWVGLLISSVVALGLCFPAHAEEKDPRLAAGIQDNLCLLEEAYNQERGVVQHINCLEHQDGNWFYNFTQEWPMGGQTNQFSYTLPYAWLHSEGQRAEGLGDVMLNYRRQALYETDILPAFAPRLSLILPTGDESEDLGMGSLGYEVWLPVSKIVSNRVTLHANAGMTSYFDVDGRQPTSYLLGGAFVYAVTRNFNLLVESFGEWDETVTDAGTIERQSSYTISPGARYAFNLSAGQLVLAAGAPIQMTQGADPDCGAYFYLSFEHRFR